jgi:hypothetical protein
MADKKISALPAATTPLAGTEVLPIVQGGTTDQVSVANLTAGRAVTMSGLGVGVAAPASGISVAGTTAFTWSGGGTSSGLVTIGTQGTSGGSLFVNTASASSSFASGLAVDGTYPGGVGVSVINLKAVGVQSGGGYGSDLAFHTAAGATLTEQMRISSAGNITASTGNLVIGTAAKGIDFSANGGDVLSQYDEGSWTVRLFDSAGGGNQSATTVTGYYTRVGNLVQCSFWGLNNISTAGMTAGNGLFIELPFTASATGSGTGSFASENITFNGRANATPAVPVSNNRAILRAYGTGTSTATVLVSNVGAGANIDYFSMTYRV